MDPVSVPVWSPLSFERVTQRCSLTAVAAPMVAVQPSQAMNWTWTRGNVRSGVRTDMKVRFVIMTEGKSHPITGGANVRLGGEKLAAAGLGTAVAYLKGVAS